MARLHQRLGFAVAAAVAAYSLAPAEAVGDGLAPVGSYQIETPAGVPLGVHNALPPSAGPETPILIVVPGARRNAGEYRDQWLDLAVANRFIVLVMHGAAEHFPTEYEYNAGGVVDAAGQRREPRDRLFSAIEPLFDDFRHRFGSKRTTYSLYGHSAGGGFVHRFLLMEPDARGDVAIAANPAFCSMPTAERAYPFGIGGAGVDDATLRRWFAKPLVVLLGDRDIGPRTKPLSSSALAREQGPSVLARGLRFFHQSLVASGQRGTPLGWRIEVVQGVGHSNTHMASHALKYLPLQ